MKLFIIYTFLMFLNCYCPGIAQDNSLAPETEKIFLHTDRNVYMTGEYLYYKLYLKGVIGRESKYAYLVIHDIQNVPVTQIRVEINNHSAFGSIYLSDTLHSDIYQMVCYTNYMRNSGEDSFFNKEVVIANRFDKEFSLLNNPFHDDSSSVFHNQSLECTTGNENLIIHLGKEIFDQREKVIFSVEPQDIHKYSLLEFSVSISEIAPDISAEPSISEYFNKVFEASPNEEPVQNQCNFLPEINGTVIKGQISTSQFNSNLAANHSEDIKINNEFYTLLVSARDSLVNMQYAKTDSLGEFSFFLNPYYEGKELFMQLQEKVNAVIEIDDKLRLTKPFTPSVRFNMPGIRDYMNRSKNILEVQRYYSEKPLLIFENEFQPATTIPRVYYKPSLSVLPEDYIDLSDFIEISREILPSIKVRKSNDNYVLSFTGTLEKSYNNYKPIIFLDGVPINDINQIINLGSHQIKRIEILPVLRYYGEMPLGGILAVFSNNLEINTIQFKTPNIKYQVLSSQKYLRPEKHKPINFDKQIPDLRQLLLWDPKIIVNDNQRQQIEFYTSDLPGRYLINIQGITSNGIPVNGSAIITVKSKSE